MGLCSGNWVFSGLLNSLKVITYLSLAGKGSCLYLSYGDCINWHKLCCQDFFQIFGLCINLLTVILGYSKR